LLILSNHSIHSHCLAKNLAASGWRTSVELIGEPNDVPSVVQRAIADIILVAWNGAAGEVTELIHQVVRALPNQRIVVLGTPRPESQLVTLINNRRLSWFSEFESVQQLLAHLGRVLHPVPILTPAGTASTHNVRLTLREEEILNMIAEGLSNKRIAKRLGVSSHTIKNHVQHILEKLAVSDRLAAVRRFYGEHWYQRGPA
jgi:DNA-binding NarL/FixJ family response regulator